MYAAAAPALYSRSNRQSVTAVVAPTMPHLTANKSSNFNKCVNVCKNYSKFKEVIQKPEVSTIGNVKQLTGKQSAKVKHM